jgi:hypothetical protein
MERTNGDEHMDTDVWEDSCVPLFHPGKDVLIHYLVHFRPDILDTKRKVPYLVARGCAPSLQSFQGLKAMEEKALQVLYQAHKNPSADDIKIFKSGCAPGFWLSCALEELLHVKMQTVAKIALARHGQFVGDLAADWNTAITYVHKHPNKGFVYMDAEEEGAACHEVPIHEFHAKFALENPICKCCSKK